MYISEIFRSCYFGGVITCSVSTSLLLKILQDVLKVDNFLLLLFFTSIYIFIKSSEKLYLFKIYLDHIMHIEVLTCVV